MKNLINKIKFLYDKTNNKKISFEKKGVRPKKHWMVIVVSSFLVMNFLIFVSIYFYIKIENGTLFNIPDKENVSEVEVNKILLNKMVEDFDNREKTLLEIRSGKIVPTNPAL